MSDDAQFAEIGRLSNTLGTINDASRQDKVTWSNFFTQATDGGERYDGTNAERFESGNVGSTGYFRWGDRVRRAMSGKEGDVDAGGKLGDGDG